jgi:elongation factor P
MGVRSVDLRKGRVIEKDGHLLLITEFTHKTPGNLRAIIQMTLKNISTGQTSSIRAGSGEMFELAYLDKKKCEYLYKEGNGDFVFMDNVSYEQFPLPQSLAAESMGFVRENATVDVTFHGTTPIGIDLPSSVTLKVTESEAAVKGNTASNVKKDAVVETGMKVRVPMHIKVGEDIKISTSDGEFQGRA